MRADRINEGYRHMIEKLDMNIVPAGDGWTLVENGRDGTTRYATCEAAFEAIVGSVSNAIKEGLEVSLHIATIPGRAND